MTKALRQQRAALVAQMQDVVKRGTWTSEDKERWSKLDLDQEKLEKQIRSLELGAEMREFTPPAQGQPYTGSEQRGERSPIFELRSSERYSTEFEKYLRGGYAGDSLREMETRTALTETTTGGGYLIPVGFQKELETKLKAFGGMRRNARIVTTATGNTLNWPTWDDTSNTGQWLAINTDATTQANPTFGQVPFTANVASSKQVLVPVQLLQDSAFDLQAELSEAFAIRLGRLTNNGYTLGNGSTAPNGVIPQVVAFGSGSQLVTASGDTQSGNTRLNSIGVNDISNLISQLDVAYRPGAKFMANQSTFDAMRKLKDSMGRPLWEVSISQGVPDRIFGYEYDWNADMAAIGAGNYSLLFGQFSKYVIRDVLGIQVVRFNELYMGSYQVGFQAYLRTDGQLLQGAAFSLLVHPLS